MTTTHFSNDRAAHILKLYPSFYPTMTQELSITSDLAYVMINDIKHYFEQSKWEIAESILSAMTTWLKKDFHYLREMSKVHFQMYDLDLKTCIQTLNLLTEECGKYKQWNTVHILEREYAKMLVYYPINYSTTTPIDANLSIR